MELPKFEVPIEIWARSQKEAEDHARILKKHLDGGIFRGAALVPNPPPTPYSPTTQNVDDGAYVRAALAKATQRANGLADVCQTLRDENTSLLLENARLRRGKR